MDLKKGIQVFLHNTRNKQVALNIISAFIIKGVALLISLCTLPAYIKFFDNQVVLGIWYTLLSVVSWVFTFDLGMGNGLRNKLVEAIAKNDKKEIKETISSAYYSIGVLVVLFVCVGFFSIRFVNWNTILNVSEEVLGKTALKTSVFITIIGILIQFFLKLINSILYALQLSSINNFLALITSASQFAYVVFAPRYGIEQNLINLSFVHAICSNVPLIVATVLVFSRKTLKGCWPRIKFFRKEKAKDILRLGCVFLWAQIMFMLLTNTNEYLITYFSAPENTVDYQIYNKIFTAMGSIVALTLTPLWSAITKAKSENDYLWMKKTYGVLHKCVFLVVAVELIVAVFTQQIFDLWLREDSIIVNYYAAFGFAIYGSLFIWQTVESTIACGTSQMKAQIVVYTICVVFKIGLSIVLLQRFDSWIPMIMVNALCMGSYGIVQLIVTNKFFNRRISQNNLLEEKKDVE